MDALTFFGLSATDDPNRWRMPIVPGIVSGNGSLYGGCGLGSAIEVMEQVTGRPCAWATAQYLSFARPPSVLELDAQEVVRGHQISQARVIAHVGETEVLTVVGALGERPVPAAGQWAQRPDVPPPDECPTRTHGHPERNTISARLQARVARGRNPDTLDGTPGSGRAALWVHIPELLDVSAAALAIVGDYVPFGVSQALGMRAGGNSLDNTLRVARRVPTEWVLADVRVHAVADGFAHGLVHLWAQDGTLLATASQSAKVRFWRDHDHPHEPEDQHEPPHDEGHEKAEQAEQEGTNP